MTTVPTASADSEWVTKRADQLHVGEHIAGDLLPLGQPGEVIFTRFFERNNSEWMFVAFVQWDGFHDSTTFLASAAIRVQPAEQPRVADPTGLAYSRADDDAEVDDFIQAANEDMIAALSQVVDTEAGLRRIKEAARVPMHTGGLTEQGLVDETERPECGAWCADGPGGLCTKDLGHDGDHGGEE